MNYALFVEGVKTAAIGQNVSDALLKLSPELANFNSTAGSGINELSKLTTLLKEVGGTVGGAAAGGGLGYLSGGKDEHDSKRNALIGALLGGGAGLTSAALTSPNAAPLYDHPSLP